MTATSSPPRPDPTRTGAVWVTGTGAFLLLAAAAVFTAMRWDQIPDAAKLGALGLVTGACLLAGRALKPTLPATAGALLHLGAFLVPLDVAALGVRGGLDWSGLLLAVGLAATVTFGWGAVTERSVVLRWATAVAVVALAGGIGATTALPAPLVLTAFGAAAVALRHDQIGAGWAALAGLAPLLSFFDELTVTGAGTFERLGLTGEQPRLLAVVTGATAAVVLGLVGRRRHDVGLVLIGVGLGAVGLAASWSGATTDGFDTFVGLATAFLLVQLVALGTSADPFWRIPADVVARLTAVVAGPVVALAAAVVVLFHDEDLTEPRAALAAAVLALGWLVADRRQVGSSSALTTVGLATSVIVAAGTVATDASVLALTLTAVAAAAVLLPRRGGLVVAASAAVWAPALPDGSSIGLATIVATGVVGSLLLTEAAVRRSSVTGADDRFEAAEGQAWVLALLALVPGLMAVSELIVETGHTAATLIGAAVLATAVAAVADRGRVTGDLPLGTIARIGGASVVLAALELPPTQLGLVATAVAALSVADAVRLGDPRVAVGASIVAPVAVGALVHATGLTLPSTGVALTVAAVVVAGLGALVGPRWTLPVAVAVTLTAGSGLLLASASATTFADALMVTSGLGLAIAIERGRLDGVYLAGIGVTGGLWLRLTEAEVGASEPYLAPVAVLLLVAGLRARSMGTSSWIAYGPVVGLLGGSALVERIAGGGGGHALFAGAVGVVAVAVGGQRRLAAPLFLGTGLLVALAGYETLAITAGLPTWTWLALGGSTLLGAGVAMERHDLGPIETGRRLVDVVDEKFA
ncbi:MAG: SCO7613 C-terminal domain-containing membrane protein [Acidimicrobiales bacterium]